MASNNNNDSGCGCVILIIAVMIMMSTLGQPIAWFMFGLIVGAIIFK